MIIKDICGKFEAISNFIMKLWDCESMLRALEQDFSVDIYLDTQPGGGTCAAQNRALHDLTANKLDQLTLAVPFGELYTSGSEEDRKLLQHLTDLTGRSPDYLGAIQNGVGNVLFVSSAFHIMETAAASNPCLAQETVTSAILDSVFSVGNLIGATICFDANAHCLKYKMDVTREINNYLDFHAAAPTMMGLCRYLAEKAAAIS